MQRDAAPRRVRFRDSIRVRRASANRGELSELVVESNREPATAADAGPSPRMTERDVPEPAWLRALVLIAASAVVSFGLVGLALAIPGWYRTWLVFLVGLLSTSERHARRAALLHQP